MFGRSAEAAKRVCLSFLYSTPKPLRFHMLEGNTSS